MDAKVPVLYRRWEGMQIYCMSNQGSYPYILYDCEILLIYCTIIAKPFFVFAELCITFCWWKLNLVVYSVFGILLYFSRKRMFGKGISARENFYK